MQAQDSNTLNDALWHLPSGQRALARETVIHAQRSRLFYAIAQASATHGYGDTSVAQIIALAGVSRRTFYELFRNKEDCLLAACEAGHRDLIDAIKHSQIGIDDVSERLVVAHRTFLTFYSQRPAMASVALCGLDSAGPRATALRIRSNQEFVDMHTRLHEQCRAVYPDLPTVSRPAFLGLVGAIREVITHEIYNGRAAQLTELLPDILYLARAIYRMPQQPTPTT